ncbi:hypothetical protein CEXT_73171 [Caerostris extrusa]|uniref:Uncharacterized protein n=1 Tax=Caerostris extrusa TaxID=172846 RepID=A0AAV4XLI9_CAEEX|nr:hypothetical protein CEXT_73171 [Caerostris extrusa]
MGKQFHGQKTSMRGNRKCFPSNDTETPPKLRSFFGGFQEGGGGGKRSEGKKFPKDTIPRIQCLLSNGESRFVFGFVSA